jgi:endo-1,4-beta-D-glucanase Y
MSLSFPSSVAASLLLAFALSGSACSTSPVGAGTGGTPGATGSGGGSATGSGGSSGTIVMKDPSAYPHNTAGATYPFPQGHAQSRCPFPAYNTDTVAKAYTNWKTKFYQDGRVVRPGGEPGGDPRYPNDTVSEGIAYGMLIGVYMNDRPMFDALWSYAKSKRDGNGFMNWRIDQGGNVVQPGGGATDADEDMAWALLMADKQWTGGPYLGEATTLINAIWDKEVDQGGGNVLKPGGNFGGAGLTNPSYFAPSYYRQFAKVTPSHNWMAVVESSYTILGKASGSFGLVPNWTNSNGTGVNGPNNDAMVDPHFGYDACRTPWRIALDYCENGEPRAKAYLDKITAFFAGQNPLKDGYTVSGGDPTGTLGDFGAGMAIFGPGAAAAMGSTAPGRDAFLTNAQRTLEQATTGSSMANPGVFTYYNGSWGLLGLITTSGNFWNMTL